MGNPDSKPNWLDEVISQDRAIEQITEERDAAREALRNIKGILETGEAGIFAGVAQRCLHEVREFEAEHGSLS